PHLVQHVRRHEVRMDVDESGDAQVCGDAAEALGLVRGQVDGDRRGRRGGSGAGGGLGNGGVIGSHAAIVERTISDGVDGDQDDASTTGRLSTGWTALFPSGPLLITVIIEVAQLTLRILTGDRRTARWRQWRSSVLKCAISSACAGSIRGRTPAPPRTSSTR